MSWLMSWFLAPFGGNFAFKSKNKELHQIVKSRPFKTTILVVATMIVAGDCDSRATTMIVVAIVAGD